MTRKRVVTVLAGVLGLAVVGIGLSLMSLGRAARQPANAPFPPIRADPSPAALVRGETIFQATCVSCHAEPGQTQASGAAMADVPQAFGTFYARNLTSDPNAGIGRLSDEAIARAIRYGISADGRRLIMPSFAMGDEDIAAILGFLRSPSPLLAPSPKASPPSQTTWLGSVIMYVSKGGSAPSKLPASGIPTPPPTPTASYGHYLAHAVYGCAECHTPGYASDKVEGEAAFSGGFAFRGSDGKEIHSANITRDGTGLFGWRYDEFAEAVRDGIRPDGTPVRFPMPRFRVPEVELKALWAYLNKVPRRQGHVAGYVPVEWERRRPPPAAAPAAVTVTGNATPSPTETTPAQLFVQLGCQACHAVGAAFHAQIVAGRSKPASQLAQWIRHPELLKPGTAMPTFASRLSEEQALRLAEWIKKTPPEKLPGLVGSGTSK